MNQEIYAKYIIIGAGPGGLQMGYFLERAGHDYLILERNETAGSFFATQPRHRKLISINKKYNFFTEEDFNWRHDWNSLLSDDPSMRFTQYSDELFPHADSLYQYLQDYAQRFKLNIAYKTTVTLISKDDNGNFVLTTDSGQQYRCQVLMLSLGAVKPNMPDIEGIELTTSYEEQSTDLEMYRNKRVGIIGQGNSAFETADYLSGVASFVHVLTKRPLKMAWDTHFVGDLRAVNNSVIDMYQLKSLHAVLNPRITKISRTEEGLLQTNHEYDFPHASRPGTLKLTREYDYIIRCTGWKWMNETLFAENCRPETWHNGKFPQLNASWESTNVKNLFFIGGAMQSNDRKASSGFIHGFRYNIRTLFHLLQERYESIAYPCQIFNSFDWDSFLDQMYQRVSVTAALFQLYGVLCDVLVFSEDMKTATLYQELPFKYAKELTFSNQHVLIFTLEFGFEHFKESAVTFLGPSDPTNTDCTSFLHPVIRHYFNGTEATFRFGDSLLARWDRPHGTGGAVMSYHYAFQKWLEQQLGLDFNLPKPEEGGSYHFWSDEQIMQWQENHVMEEKAPTCHKAS
jgi:thioredoxin reductase